MGRPNSYYEKYEKAKKLYSQGVSLTKISKELEMDRGTLSKNLKKDGVEVVNRQNLSRVNENIFEIIDTEEKAYWLGFMYADGYVGDDNTIEVGLKSSDVNHLIKLKKFLSWSGEVYQDEIRCRLAFKNKKMKEDLIKLGCVPRKSLILTFPTYDTVPIYLMKHFIRGYVDGDGSIGIRKNGKAFRLSILGTKEFLTGLLKHTEWKPLKIQNPSNIYVIEWGADYVKEYLDYLYEDSTVYLDRKYNVYLSFDESRLGEKSSS